MLQALNRKGNNFSCTPPPPPNVPRMFFSFHSRVPCERRRNRMIDRRTNQTRRDIEITFCPVADEPTRRKQFDKVQCVALSTNCKYA